MEFTPTHQTQGSPDFEPDGYHIKGPSAAVDKGISADLSQDIDNEVRPNGSASHLGADEYYAEMAPASVEILGPLTTYPQVAEAYLAVVTPVSASLPLTYTWEASDQAPVIHGSGITDTVTYTWVNTGIKSITVTVANDFGVIAQSMQVEVQPDETKIYIPVIRRND